MKQEQQEKYKRYDYLNKYNQLQILQSHSKSRKFSNQSLSLDPAHQLSQDKYSNRNRSLSQKQRRTIQKPLFYNQPDTSSPNKIFNRIPDLTHGLSAEIATQNQILKNQVCEYKRLVTKLQNELNLCQQEMQLMRQKIRADSYLYQQNLSELNKRMSEYKLQSDYLNHQLMERTSIQQKIQQEYDQQQQIFYSEIILKFVNLLPTNSQDKLKELITYGSLDDAQKTVLEHLKEQLKKNSLFYDFVITLHEMHLKIEKVQLQKDDLKGLWKWLKKIGCVYHHLENLRPVLLKKLGIKGSKQGQMHHLETHRTEQLIDEMLFTYDN